MSAASASVDMHSTDTSARRLRFVEPLPGLGAMVDFDLMEVPGAPGLYVLRAADAEAPRLFLVDPSMYVDSYEPRIPRSVGEKLGADSVDLLVVIHPPQGNEPPTANLLAPVVVAPQTGLARQVLLEDQPWSVREPLVQDDAEH